MRAFLIFLKSAGAAIAGAAAGAAAQSLSTGQPLTQAKTAAIGGALTAVVALFAPPPHR